MLISCTSTFTCAPICPVCVVLFCKGNMYCHIQELPFSFSYASRPDSPHFSFQSYLLFLLFSISFSSVNGDKFLVYSLAITLHQMGCVIDNSVPHECFPPSSDRIRGGMKSRRNNPESYTGAVPRAWQTAWR